MADVTVKVETPRGITLESCVLPDDYSPDVFVPDLVLQLGLPYKAESGVSVRDSILSNYALYNVSHGYHLMNHERLREAGVRDGDILRLVPVQESAPAASASPPPQVIGAPVGQEDPETFMSVTIDTPHQIIEHCMIPDHFTAERVIRDMVEELPLLSATQEGAPIAYALFHANSNSVLPPQKVLRESGVKDGETLRLVSDYFRKYALGAD